jgi:hypothetical protein
MGDAAVHQRAHGDGAERGGEHAHCRGETADGAEVGHTVELRPHRGERGVRDASAETGEHQMGPRHPGVVDDVNHHQCGGERCEHPRHQAQ